MATGEIPSEETRKQPVDEGTPQREYDPQRDVDDLLTSGTKVNDNLTGTNDPVLRKVPGSFRRKPKQS